MAILGGVDTSDVWGKASATAEQIPRGAVPPSPTATAMQAAANSTGNTAGYKVGNAAGRLAGSAAGGLGVIDQGARAVTALANNTLGPGDDQVEKLQGQLQSAPGADGVAKHLPNWLDQAARGAEMLAAKTYDSVQDAHWDKTKLLGFSIDGPGHAEAGIRARDEKALGLDEESMRENGRVPVTAKAAAPAAPAAPAPRPFQTPAEKEYDLMALQDSMAKNPTAQLPTAQAPIAHPGNKAYESQMKQFNDTLDQWAAHKMQVAQSGGQINTNLAGAADSALTRMRIMGNLRNAGVNADAAYGNMAQTPGIHQMDNASREKTNAATNATTERGQTLQHLPKYNEDMTIQELYANGNVDEASALAQIRNPRAVVPPEKIIPFEADPVTGNPAGYRRPDGTPVYDKTPAERKAEAAQAKATAGVVAKREAQEKAAREALKAKGLIPPDGR